LHSQKKSPFYDDFLVQEFPINIEGSSASLLKDVFQTPDKIFTHSQPKKDEVSNLFKPQ
jgi:hypothetical protein